MALVPAITINLPGYPFQNFPSIETIADLRALASIDLADGDNYVVDGGSTVGDGGGGVFAWNDGLVAADDGATIIKPNDTAPGSAGRWILIGSAQLKEVAEDVAAFSEPTGASLVGSDDGSSGSKWTTVAGFISYLMSSVGSAIVGFIQSGTGAVARTSQDKMRERVTPYDFGAVGDGVVDDTVALQRFADYVMSNNTKIPVMEGVFKVTSKISFIGTANASPVINCQARINAAFTAEDEIILFSNWNFGNITGSLAVWGGGGSTWSTRTNGVGVLINNCSRLNAEMIYVQYTKYYGVKNTGTTSLNKFGFVSTRWCGTRSTTGVNLSISSASNTGSQSSIGQRTALTVDTVPSYIEPGISMCIIGGGLYFITATDPVNSIITVYPWIDSTVTFPANLELLVGGGFYAQGGDGSCIYVGTLDAIQCAIGIYNRSLYMTSVDNAVLQSNGVGFVLGNSITSGSRGGQCALSYYEGNSFDIVKLTTDECGFNFGSARVIEYSKCLQFAPRDGSNNFAVNATVLNGVRLAGFSPSHDFPFGLGASGITATPTPAPMSFYNISRNSQTLSLTMDKNLNRLFGYGSMFIMAEGTGPNLNPTGTYTFNPPTGGTINGGAVNTPLNVSGMTYPTLFHVRSGDGLAWTVTSCPFAP